MDNNHITKGRTDRGILNTFKTYINSFSFTIFSFTDFQTNLLNLNARDLVFLGKPKQFQPLNNTSEQEVMARILHILDQEGNVLFNDALNTLYFTPVIWCRTYGKGPLR